jgi:hypothetical protein
VILEIMDCSTDSADIFMIAGNGINAQWSPDLLQAFPKILIDYLAQIFVYNISCKQDKIRVDLVKSG